MPCCGSCCPAVSKRNVQQPTPTLRARGDGDWSLQTVSVVSIAGSLRLARPHAATEEGAMMNRPTRLVLLLVLGVLLLGGAGVATWAWLRPGAAPTALADQEGVAQAAATAAELPVNRSAALDPLLTDDPQAVPVYPVSTRIVLDQATWRGIGESASAYATVAPPGQRVLIYFARLDGRWRITQIDTQP